MPVQAGFAKIAALLADPAREAMLVALADGLALPAGELAEIAGVTSQSASGHLRKLVEGGVVSVWPQGRFRYFRLADEEIASVLEALAGVACSRPGRTVSARLRPPHLLAARCCYNHMAGRLGVAFADALVNHDYVRICRRRRGANEHGLAMAGSDWLAHTEGEGGQLADISGSASIGPNAGFISRALFRPPSSAFCSMPVTSCGPRSGPLAVTPTGKAWFGQLGVKTI